MHVDITNSLPDVKEYPLPTHLKMTFHWLLMALKGSQSAVLYASVVDLVAVGQTAESLVSGPALLQKQIDYSLLQTEQVEAVAKFGAVAQIVAVAQVAAVVRVEIVALTEAATQVESEGQVEDVAQEAQCFVVEEVDSPLTEIGEQRKTDQHFEELPGSL